MLTAAQVYLLIQRANEPIYKSKLDQVLYSDWQKNHSGKISGGRRR